MANYPVSNIALLQIDYNENTNTANIKAKRVPYPAANQGCVSKAKDKFEVKSRESSTPTKSRGTTPFSSRTTRSPSPAPDTAAKKRTFSVTNSEHCEVHSPFARGRSGTGTKLNLRKRSPSPVVTGKVSSFRSKFEPASSSGSPSSAQTIPRTFRTYRDPADIFYHHTPPLHSPGNLRVHGRLSGDSGPSRVGGLLSRDGSRLEMSPKYCEIRPVSAVNGSYYHYVQTYTNFR